MDRFISLYANVISPDPMSREDVLGYVVFCTITCNGTSHVAEIVRFITELCAHDRDSCVFVKDKRCEWMHSKAGVRQFYMSCSNMYNFLFAVSSGYYPKSSGTCCDPRYTFSNRGKRFHFEEHSKWILDQIDENMIEIDDRERNNLIFVVRKYTNLKASLGKINGFGPMCVQEVIQLSALLRLTPPQMAKCASCDGEDSKSRGPNILIRLCMDATMEKSKTESVRATTVYNVSTDQDTDDDVDESEINKIFLQLHEELMKIVSKSGAQTRFT